MEYYEFGIIGMGPAGIGLAWQLAQSKKNCASVICFERGHSINSDIECIFFDNTKGCNSDACQIITGIGGASKLSSGKISNYPAGSHLLDFFETEKELQSSLDHLIDFFSQEINLAKVEVDEDKRANAVELFKNKGIEYKYYDVYKFDGIKYKSFLNKLGNICKLKDIKICTDSEVVNIKRIENKKIFKVKVKSDLIEKEFLIKKIIIATGALDVNDKLLDTVLKTSECGYEIGLRVEFPSSLIASYLSYHGDLKLKYKAGRTYCVTECGKIIRYKISGLSFLEGSLFDNTTTGYTNLAVLIKSNSSTDINFFLERYKNFYKGNPIKQLYVDYKNNSSSDPNVFTTLEDCRNGNINDVFPSKINMEIKNFIEKVFVETMNIPEEKITVVAPELKILRKLDIKNNFEVKENFYVIGAATGRFRGILQSFCSGIRCGQLLCGDKS